MSNEMVRRDGVSMVAAYVPRDVPEAQRMAEMLAAGGLFPGYRDQSGQYNAAKMFTVMALGAAMGMGPAQALGAFHVVEGRPTLSAHGMVGVIRAHGGRVRVVDEGASHCTVEGNMPGEPPSRATFTLDEAVAAGRCEVVGGKVRSRSRSGKPTPWETSTADMLYARAVSRLARRLAPDLIAGIMSADEVEQVAQAEREPAAATDARTEAGARLVERRMERLRSGAPAPSPVADVVDVTPSADGRTYRLHTPAPSEPPVEPEPEPEPEPSPKARARAALLAGPWRENPASVEAYLQHVHGLAMRDLAGLADDDDRFGAIAEWCGA
jgi:hypothetical protein